MERFEKELTAVCEEAILIGDENTIRFSSNLPFERIAIPPGERSKSREMKAWLEDALLSRGLGRDALLIALGGGVVSDLVGFVAATFCRGIPWIYVPTTLIGMVDCSVGGKVGINTPHGKNLIGAFHPPQKVILDTHFLTTLPDDEIHSGVAEILKYGCISNTRLFQHLDDPLDLKLIEQCRRIKQEIVSLDPYEKGLRRILNFGHTVGHAIETHTGYRISHGNAVGSGMRIAARLSHRLGYLEEEALQQLEQILDHHGFSLYPLNTEIVDLLKHDKKSRAGKSRFVLLETLGKPHPFAGEYCVEVDPNLVEEVCLSVKAG